MGDAKTLLAQERLAARTELPPVVGTVAGQDRSPDRLMMARTVSCSRNETSDSNLAPARQRRQPDYAGFWSLWQFSCHLAERQ